MDACEGWIVAVPHLDLALRAGEGYAQIERVEHIKAPSFPDPESANRYGPRGRTCSTFPWPLMPA
jgi:hypothetical protein